MNPSLLSLCLHARKYFFLIPPIFLTAILIAFTLSFLSCNNNNSGYSTNNVPVERPKTPEELRTELKQLEQASPLTYISDKDVTLTPQKKLVRAGGLFRDPEYAPDGGVIKGDLINKAALAKYKDIIVKVSFYSETETLIESKSYVIYKYLEPNSTKHFEMKIQVLPIAYKEFSFEITGATPVNN